MTLSTKLMLAGACAAALTAVTAVQAQPYGGPSTGGPSYAGPTASGRATLYEYPNFQGRSVTINGAEQNLANSNFNDIAQSGRFDGPWTICSDAYLRGTCRSINGDARDLNQFAMGRSISSLRAGGDGTGGGWGDNDRYGDNNGGYNDGRGDNNRWDDNRGGSGGWNGGGGGNFGGESYQGRSAVFFPRPQSNSGDIAALDRRAADWFCRRQGLRDAIYYDAASRGRGWGWQSGGFTTNTPVLRDVLCRR